MATQDMTTTRTVMFVCLHGSAKSLIAAEYFRHLAATRGMPAQALSAGVEPDSEVPPKVVAGLLEDGIDVRGRQPRQVTAEELRGAWHVVSFGCDLSGLLPPGASVERWDDIPAVSENFRVARDVIVSRVVQLLTHI